MSLAQVEPAWRAGAVCQDATARHFFPPPTTETRDERSAREETARALCLRCRVREACLEYALQVHEAYGIWGGLTEAERRRLHRVPVH